MFVGPIQTWEICHFLSCVDLKWERVPGSSGIPWTKVPLAAVLSPVWPNFGHVFCSWPWSFGDTGVLQGSCASHWAEWLRVVLPPPFVSSLNFCVQLCPWTNLSSSVLWHKEGVRSCPPVLAPLNLVPPVSAGWSSREGAGEQLSDCGPSCLSAAQRDDSAPSKSSRKTHGGGGGGGEWRLRRWRWVWQRLWGWRAASEEPAPLPRRWWDGAAAAAAPLWVTADGAAAGVCSSCLTAGTPVPRGCRCPELWAVLAGPAASQAAAGGEIPLLFQAASLGCIEGSPLEGIWGRL